MNNKIIVNISLVVSLACGLFFTLFADYDIAVSRYFYEQNDGFIGKTNDIIRLIFYSIPILSESFAVICVVDFLSMLFKQKPFDFVSCLRKFIITKSFYLLLTLAIGPALIVNYGLKDNFGRARPHQIVEFNGEKQFTRAFVISDQCQKNCSFSSGHAAMAFYFTALAFIARASLFNVIFIGGIIFGSLVGYIRIIMGGHFISDVAVSAFIVILVNYMVYLRWEKFKQNRK